MVRINQTVFVRLLEHDTKCLKDTKFVTRGLLPTSRRLSQWKLNSGPAAAQEPNQLSRT